MMRTHYVDELKKEIGKTVTLAGWVHDVRIKGGINFILLRDRTGIVQVVATKENSNPKTLDLVQKLHQEDVIVVIGKAVKSKIAKVGIEMIPEKIEVISKAAVPLPLDPREVTPANFDTRLDNRTLDLRKPQNLAIFKVQEKLIDGMISFLKTNGFLEVHTPTILGGISEGGADVFKIDHFGKNAYLRQDPQLHRQLTIAAGFDKIFDYGSNWRAEPSYTTRHVSEFHNIAPEMAFIKDEEEVMRLEETTVAAGVKNVIKETEEELKILNKEIKVPKTPFPELRFPEIYSILENLGKKIPFGEDYDRESEVLLWKFVKERYGSDFFFVNRFPFAAKSFYVMRVDEEPTWARSVDLIFKGLEQSSGGQREHRYDKLVEQIKLKNLNPRNLEWFTEPFRFGIPPHGGFSIGLERFTMKLLDLENIREAILFPRDTKRLTP